MVSLAALAGSWLPLPAQGAMLNWALLRLNRQQQFVTTSFTVEFAPNLTSGVTRVVITLPAGFGIGALGVNTSALDPGVQPLPGGLSVSASGSQITVAGVGPLTAGASYGFTVSSVTLPAAGTYNASVDTRNNANQVSESTPVQLAILASDGIGASGGVVGCGVSGIGDINHDGHVNIFDLSILLTHYSGVYCPADFNVDHIVNIFDLSILLTHYGT